MLLSVLAGCPDRTVSSVPTTQGSVELKELPAIPRRDLDILFLIDNSRSMKEEQDSLKANFGRFITVLESTQGGLPNVHIGVTTSDLGTSTADGMTSGSKFGCANGGDGGTLRPLASGARYIVDEDDGHGGRTRNYTGALADAFTEIANVGILGCGIEQHLAAIDKALVGNPTNQGFLRDDAYLAIIVIADEDDCSLAHAGLFDGTADGDVANFRCTEDGVTCDSPTTDFLGATGPRADCHPSAAPRWLEQPKHYADMIKGLKANPKDVIVAGIVGPTDKFGITKTSSGTTVLGSSCEYQKPQSTEKQVAFPAVRTSAFLEAFPTRFTREKICEPDLSPALLAVSQLIAEVVGTRCFESALADVDPNTQGAQYDCSVVEVRRVANHPDEEIVVVPACPGDGTAGGACWKIVVDAELCLKPQNPQHLALDIEWNGAPHDESLYVKANCVTESTDGGGPFQ